MQCPKCGKNGFVVISNKRFCSNCGAKLAGPNKPASMADIKGGSKPLDLRAQAPATPAPTPAATTARPANQLHGAQVAGRGVLDLRTSQPPKPTPEPIAAPPQISPATAQQPMSKPEPEVSPAPELTRNTPKSTPLDTKSPMIEKMAAHPALPERNPLPAATATHVDMMQHIAKTAPEPPTVPKSPDLQQALSAAKKSRSGATLLKLGSGVAAVAIMAGVVWYHNSPKLAFHNAASKAGVQASLPTYVPSSYHQEGKAKVADGSLTLYFSSPGADQALAISQKSSGWDSESLRENYVSRQSKDFLSVQGQGLTIFLYNNNANWVNHGVWYTVSGTAKLSREQVLKVAYGL